MHSTKFWCQNFGVLAFSRSPPIRASPNRKIKYPKPSRTLQCEREGLVSCKFAKIKLRKLLRRGWAMQLARFLQDLECMGSWRACVVFIFEFSAQSYAELHVGWLVSWCFVLRHFLLVCVEFGHVWCHIFMNFLRCAHCRGRFNQISYDS